MRKWWETSRLIALNRFIDRSADMNHYISFVVCCGGIISEIFDSIYSNYVSHTSVKMQTTSRFVIFLCSFSTANHSPAISHLRKDIWISWERDLSSQQRYDLSQESRWTLMTHDGQLGRKRLEVTNGSKQSRHERWFSFSFIIILSKR